jgi:hypothetical protein
MVVIIPNELTCFVFLENARVATRVATDAAFIVFVFGYAMRPLGVFR